MGYYDGKGIYFLSYSLYHIREAKNFYKLYNKTRSALIYSEYLLNITFATGMLGLIKNFNLYSYNTEIEGVLKEVDIAEKYGIKLVASPSEYMQDDFYDIKFIENYEKIIGSFLNQELNKIKFFDKIKKEKNKLNCIIEVLGLTGKEPGDFNDLIKFFRDFSLKQGLLF